MRYDAEHKQRTRQKVLSEAAAAIREHGPGGIGVADLMAKAGLTHGGFYAHFKSKDALVAEAVSEMFDERFEIFLAATEGRAPADGLARFIDAYLSLRHRDNVKSGCPVPSLAGDLARLPHAARKRFDAGIGRWLEAMAALLRAMKKPEPEALAASVLAELAGALALSRAVATSALSEKMLAASRTAIRQRIGLPV
jgi:TetR/AcrR family transcriptional repressor of nem operon